jgi:hypothetical protein
MDFKVPRSIREVGPSFQFGCLTFLVTLCAFLPPFLVVRETQINGEDRKGDAEKPP